MDYLILATDIIEVQEIIFIKNSIFIQGDITEYIFQKKIFEENEIVVVHLAAEKSLIKCEENYKSARKLNVEASLSLYSLANDYQAHYIFISSDQVFDGEKGNYSEFDKQNPKNQYSRFKMEVERAIATFANVSVCRTSLVFGTVPTSHTQMLMDNCESDILVLQSQIVQHTVARLKQEKKIILPADEFASPTHVELLGRQIYIIIQQKLSGIFH